jgi:hypothetical protein
MMRKVPSSELAQEPRGIHIVLIDTNLGICRITRIVAGVLCASKAGSIIHTPLKVYVPVP